MSHTTEGALRSQQPTNEATGMSSGGQSRAAIIAAAVVTGAVGKVWFLAWHPPYGKDEVVPYDALLGIRPSSCS